MLISGSMAHNWSGHIYYLWFGIVRLLERLVNQTALVTSHDYKTKNQAIKLGLGVDIIVYTAYLYILSIRHSKLVVMASTYTKARLVALHG